MVAFERALANDFGIETDVRDFHGQVVIAHDPVVSECVLLQDLLAMMSPDKRHLTLALNIKADGLQHVIKQALDSCNISNYFLFDMSVPDAVRSMKHGLSVFTRESDVEPVPAFYSRASGVWLDGFDEMWFGPADIFKHLKAGKSVCVVSPELHSRPERSCWESLKSAGVHKEAGMMLCTDKPEEARRFFYGAD